MPGYRGRLTKNPLWRMAGISASMPLLTMPAPRSTRPSPSNGSALLLARIIYYVGLLLGTMFAAVVGAVYYSNFGNLTDSKEKAMVAAVLGALSIISFGFARIAHSRIPKLK